MIAYLLRHAHAGDRLPSHRDRYRPLSPRGKSQAHVLANYFEPFAVHRVLTSPATRCKQTVEPLLAAKQLPCEEQEDLWEDARPLDVFSVTTQAAQQGPENTGLLVCTHGNLIPDVIDLAAQQGATVAGRGCEKGSIWVLTGDTTGWQNATYIPPQQS